MLLRPQKKAGSILSQKGTSKHTSAVMEDFASKVLQSDKYSKDAKELAGTMLSQSSKKAFDLVTKLNFPASV